MIQKLNERLAVLILGLLVAVFIIVTSSTSCQAAGPWKGQIVDRETRQPVGGGDHVFCLVQALFADGSDARILRF